MFGLLDRKRPIVFEHWLAPILDFSSDAAAFYKSVEEELKSRQVPTMVSERVLYHDGGSLSQKREYLRFRRETLIFDILSAQFGTSWWFSCRSAVLPRRLRLWEVLVFALLVAAFAGIYWQTFGIFVGSIVMGSSLLMVLVMMVAGRSWNGMDDLLLRLPVLGAFYESIFRPESYYRDDARRMYVSIVDFVVREKVKEFAAAGGIETVSFSDVTDSAQLSSLIQRMQAVIANPSSAAKPSKRS
jgi:hypothetical protein